MVRFHVEGLQDAWQQTQRKVGPAKCFADDLGYVLDSALLGSVQHAEAPSKLLAQTMELFGEQCHELVVGRTAMAASKQDGRSSGSVGDRTCTSISAILESAIGVWPGDTRVVS